MGRRPDGTDGSDFQYRMVIENKYKRLASTRKLLRLAVVGHTLYFVLRAGLHCTPLLIDGQVSVTSQVAAVVAALCTALYLFGTGKPNKENLSLLRAYSFLLLGLIIGVVADGALQGNLLSEARYYAPLLIRFHHTHSLDAGTLSLAIRVVGSALDALGVTSSLAGALLALRYASDASIKKHA